MRVDLLQRCLRAAVLPLGSVDEAAAVVVKVLVVADFRIHPSEVLRVKDEAAAEPEDEVDLAGPHSCQWMTFMVTLLLPFPPSFRKTTTANVSCVSKLYASRLPLGRLLCRRRPRPDVVHTVAFAALPRV